MLPREDEFTAARELIERAIIAIARGDHLPQTFPSAAVGYFNRFGRTLQAGECIRLSGPDAKREARYTPAVRKALLLSRERTYRSNRSALGRIVEIDAEASTFTLRTPDRNPVKCHFESELFTFIRGALQPDGAGPVVAIEGEAVLDDRDRILRMHVAEVALNDDPADASEEVPEAQPRFPALEREHLGTPNTKLLQRLDELAALRDGWLDGAGRSPATGVIGALREIAGELFASDNAPLRLYPTPEGGVQLEWRSGTTESSVEVKADLSIYAVEVDTATGETREREENRFEPGALLGMLRDGIDG
jgi:hypothetical protein